MTTQISKNLSHRRLIKEKTNQLIDYHRITPKSSLKLKARTANKLHENLHNESIICEEHNTSIDKRIQKEVQSEIEITGKPAYFVRKRKNSNSKSKWAR